MAQRVCAMVTKPMSELTVRPATLEDAATVAALIDAFAQGHLAEGRVRSVLLSLFPLSSSCWSPCH